MKREPQRNIGRIVIEGREFFITTMRFENGRLRISAKSRNPIEALEYGEYVARIFDARGALVVSLATSCSINGSYEGRPVFLSQDISFQQP